MRRTAALAALLSGAALAGQDDLRDVVRLANGRELQGRVLEPHATGELVLHQGGRRVRLQRTDVRDVQTVGDAVREFGARRAALRGNASAQWILVEWAQSRGLPGLARLQATELALGGDERAHELLGHRRKGAQWLWPHDGRFLVREELDGLLARVPLTLTGERFQLTTRGNLAASTAALFDLEQLGVWLHDTFGSALGLRESAQPIRVAVFRNLDEFPKWGFRPSPYFVPDPHGDEARTFFLGPDRPHRLLFVGAHALLYRGLIGSVAPNDDRDRVCPWLEIGLCCYAETSLGGDPGRAAPLDRPDVARQAMQADDAKAKLANLLHLPMYSGFYQLDDAETAMWWDRAAMFARFLLDPANAPPTRAAFLGYARKALLERRGDSSSLFDAALGRPIESFEAPFRAWLQDKARR